MEPLEQDWERFLARHWQQTPLLIRNAVPNFVAPVSADQLAGLSLEADIESRIVECVHGEWHLHHGPFTAAELQREHPWTLLVQGVDKYLPEVEALRGLISPLPAWRFDDIMISYASDGGSVGPHYDNYDVFLLQAQGQRQWQVGDYCDSDAPLLDHEGLRILSDFTARQTYLLDAGDLLYLPPRYAHWGVAQGECLTVSIGLRAPRINDMVARWSDRLLESLDPELFYTDTHLEAALRPGEIRPHDLERAQLQVQAALDQMQDRAWFGELLTESEFAGQRPARAVARASRQLQAADAVVERAPGVRLAWQLEDAQTLRVFCNGSSSLYPHQLGECMQALCGDGYLRGAALQTVRAADGGARLLHELLQEGAIDVR